MTKKHSDFGSDTMIIGEATEPVNSLNGRRVYCQELNEYAVIYNVLVNRETRNVQIWANREGASGARCFRPKDLVFADTLLPLFDGEKPA